MYENIRVPHPGGTPRHVLAGGGGSTMELTYNCSHSTRHIYTRALQSEKSMSSLKSVVANDRCITFVAINYHPFVLV